MRKSEARMPGQRKEVVPRPSGAGGGGKRARLSPEDARIWPGTRWSPEWSKRHCKAPWCLQPQASNAGPAQLCSPGLCSPAQL